MMTALCYLFVAVGATIASTDCQALERFQASELHMGTKFTIVLYAADREAANRGFRAAFARIGQLDARLSDYRGDSELSRLSRPAPGLQATGAPQAQRVSDDLWRVLKHAQQLSGQTEGAFDVTVGPLTRLWRRARRRHAMPADEQIAKARSAVGYQHLLLDEASQSVTLLRPHMRFDLGGIAKGYATDEALRTLEERGIDRALVQGGGDMSIGLAPPNERGWKAGIAPLDTTKKPSRFLFLEQCGIATSGDAWQFVEIAGRRYSHVLDPRTGLGLIGQRSVTVVAPEGMIADSLATAASVLGPEKGLRLIDQTEGASALFIQLMEGQVITHASGGFDRLATEPVSTSNGHRNHEVCNQRTDEE